MIAIARRYFAAVTIAAISLLGVSVPQAHAQLTLTPAGVADGFTLVPFVSGYNFGPTCCNNYGPLAQGILPNGNVVTGSVGDHNIYVFPDSNHLTLGSAISPTPTSYASTTTNPNWAMATAGGQVYGAQLFGGTFMQFNNNGTFSPMGPVGSPVRSLADNLGMWGAPNGDLVAAAITGLVDINPSTGAVRTIVANLFPDGVSVSPDGTTIYVAIGGSVSAFAFSNGALLAAPYAVGPSPDGTGVISGGAFNGDVIVNDNNGTVGLLNPVTRSYTVIASGGSRGDFVSEDTSNGTLFLSQFFAVDRLGCGPGCSIGVGVPEPSTWAMMLLGFLGLGFAFRQSRRKASFA